MNGILDSIGSAITTVSDFVCGYPLFILLIGGGLFLFFYSGAVSLCRIGYSIKALRYKSEVAGEGQISSFQALMSAIASTVGMGNIAGVAIAITVGGPGAIFWMWVSAVVGMSTKFFEGALAIMYKGHDSAGEPQGGTMYIILHGLGERWKPFAYFFAVVGLIGTLCVMQANQLVESVTTVFTTPAGIENTLGLRFVGMGNIAGVAIAITVGGPGAIFWMWVSAVVGMSTKFFEGALAIMYKGHDSAGEPQGGTMYIILHGLGERWKPFAYFFAVVGLIGTLCVMQANQLVESVTTVFTTPAGIENTLGLRFVMGIVISLVVGAVIIGGIRRISVISAKIVPVMVTCYMLLVFVILCLNFDKLPGVLASIFQSAFSLEAGIGGILGTALTGARRAAYVNEAGVGTASMMHGASRNDNPIREGLVAMIGPAIDSGLVCTLTAFPILIAGNYASEGGIKGLYIALNSFEQLLPGYGHYLLMVMVFFFAFSTMFSYSYYGLKCTNFLFGAENAKYYNYFYLVMIVVAAMIPLGAVVAIMDLAFALMALPTMTSLLLLAPRVRRKMKEYFAN